MVHAQKITADLACSHLQNFPLIDPLGAATVKSVCASGDCFALPAKTGTIVYVLRWIGNKILILAAAGNVKGETKNCLHAIEAQAKANGAQSVMFQTARAGLVKLATQSGYQVTGWILEKQIKNETV